jgi:ABC-type dipeptide/oligopeptide/nickel transport system permease component
MAVVMAFVLRLGVTLWLCLTATFVLLRVVPGNYAQAELIQAGLSSTEIAARMEALGYNRPLWEQYASYMTDVLQGNWGKATTRPQSVREMIEQRLPHSFSLMLTVLGIATPLGVGIGWLSGMGWRVGRWLSALAQASFYLPIYWTATVVLLVVAVGLNVPQDTPFLAIGVLVFHVVGGIVRTFELEVWAVRQSDYVRMAWGKGLGARRVFLRHVLPNALIPLLGVLAVQVGILLGNTVVIETLFARQGLGLLLADAVLNRDYNVVQAIATLLAVVYVCTNEGARFLTTLLDPRLRLS